MPQYGHTGHAQPYGHIWCLPYGLSGDFGESHAMGTKSFENIIKS
jgi:hypothetical protein